MNYLRLLQLRRMSATAEGGEPAADAPVSASGETGAADQAETIETHEERAFTQADIDRVVQQTIARERARAEKAVATARTEAEKLAKMTAEQRAQHDREQREAALAQREAELNRRELRATALNTLAERGLPSTLAETLNYTDADQCNASIDSVEKAFRAAVQQGVESRMKGSVPAAATSTETTLLDEIRAAAGVATKK
ncbi:MAG: DUF4355 domain-containing protein [Eubacteriales bacterium]|nr:DUF4355 domain-containing protein [Eubacteriales bacterium]